MDDLLSFWRRLSPVRRIVLSAATIGVFLAILALARLGGGAQMSLLYAGLDSRAAGQVIAALDQGGTAYEVRGDAIYVPTTARDAMRMQLASQGLPASGGQGYELLDGLSGFGTTSQMFDAAYWRAKEGELARTALAMPNVRMARVHIAPRSGGVFQRSSDVTASITITMSTGSVSREQADALRHLVASAVGEMASEDVTVIDSVKGVVTTSGGNFGAGGDLRAEEIKRNVERLLEARVGAGRAIVEVSLDFVREREAIKERLVDPQARVAISTENETSSENSTQSSGDVTVASNLPDGDATAGQGRSQSQNSRERTNFDVSETQREILREPGAIRRLTVAVLVDGTQTIGADGSATWAPRDDQELSDLRELVAAAAGIDEARGDTLTLKSMQFQAPSEGGSMAEAGLLAFTGPLDAMTLIKYGILAVLAAILGLFVVRPLIAQGRRETAPRGSEVAGAPALPAPSGAAAPSTVLTGEIADDDLPALAQINPDWSDRDASAGEDPVTRLKRLIDSRQEESVEILRGWLEKQEEKS